MLWTHMYVAILSLNDGNGGASALVQECVGEVFAALFERGGHLARTKSLQVSRLLCIVWWSRNVGSRHLDVESEDARLVNASTNWENYFAEVGLI